MTPLLISLAFAIAADPAKPPPPLTIGCPAPKLAAMEFVRGEKVEALPEKAVTVVEFSGTQCAPCIKAIPHLNAMQKEHKGVVFLSVYSEEATEVQKFLEGPGKAIEFRVACDPKGQMNTDWSEPARQEGIPHAFVVKDGKIAWIGLAWNLEKPLGEIVAGTFDPQADTLRLAVEQGAVLKRRKVEARAVQREEEFNRINKRIIAGEYEAALKDTEKALADFADSPAAVARFRNTKLYLLIVLPDRKEEAFKMACEMAVEAKAKDRSTDMTSLAVTFLNATETVLADKRDTRLLDLAIPLLNEEMPLDLRADTPQAKRQFAGYAFFRHEQLARAYSLRGDKKQAAAAAQEAIELAKGMKPADGQDEKQFADNLKRRVDDLEAKLKEYNGK